MPVSLNPDAPNQPNGLLARVRNTRYRINSFKQTPTPEQIQGLGSVLAMESQEAYRLALRREAAKWGVSLYGPLDPFVKTRLEATAQTRATGIVSTYLRNQAAAQKQGKDLKSWQEHYASWKAPQVMQHEYASADARAVQEFYSTSRTPDGKLLEAQGRVLPLHTAVDDECRTWVARGWMPLDEALPIMAQLPLHPGCFVAGTTVAGPLVHAAFKRPYKGPIVTVRTASGNELTGTPNHPILTSKGWIGLGALQKGDYVFSARESERVARLLCPNEHQVPALIEEVGRPSSVPLLKMPVTTADFHGDGLFDTDVDVVLTDRFLQRHRSVAQKSDVSSELTGGRAREPLAPLNRESVPQSLLLGADSPASSFMSLRGDRLPFLGSHSGHAAQIPLSIERGLLGATHPDPLRLAIRPTMDTPIPQPITERGSADSALLRERVGRFPSDVSLDQIVEIRNIDTECHVYNSSTAEGWYIANNIIVSNCPHMMMVLPGSSMINADDLEDNPEPTEPSDVVPSPDWASSPDDSIIPLGSPVPTGLGQTNAPHPSYVDSEVGSAMTGSYPQGDPRVFLPNTTKLLALPSISLRSIQPHLLLDTLFTAGMSVALHQPPPPPAQGQP